MKNLILFISLVLSSVSYSQKHSVFGGNIEVTQIGSNQFIMSASVQIDSFNVSSMSINAFDNATDTFVKTFTISLDSSTIIPLRYQTHPIDTIYVNYLSDTFNLSNNPNGYYFTNNEFTRISNVNNFFHGDYLFTCQIPNPAILAGNTNPRFSNFHDSLHIIINEIRNLNFSCFDSDGDSLKYSFIQAYDAFFSIGTGSRPFNLISFRPAYNLLNLLGPAGIGSINTNNGFTSIKAIQFGKFTLAVRCEEFRNGIKIGEVYRDLTFCSNIVFSSIEENNLIETTKVFPNPNNGNFTISIEDFQIPNFAMKVYDLYGKLIHSQQINSPQTAIYLEKLNKGIYFVQLNDGINQTTKRIVIQ